MQNPNINSVFTNYLITIEYGKFLNEWMLSAKTSQTKKSIL